jgi:hypothetical protein
MGGAVFTIFRLKVKPAKYIMALVAVILLLVLLRLQLSRLAIILERKYLPEWHDSVKLSMKCQR